MLEGALKRGKGGPRQGKALDPFNFHEPVSRGMVNVRVPGLRWSAATLSKHLSW